MAIEDFGIVCFGRGIERVQERWQPTAYLEKMTPDRQHSGFQTEGLRLDSTDEKVIVAGAYANMMAIVYLFRKAVSEKNYPKLLVWAAGRPKYLEKAPPEISEGFVLFEGFKEKIGNLSQNLSQVKIESQAQNKNTFDDLMQSLQTAQKLNLGKIIIISVFVHLRRIGEFYRLALRQIPEFNQIKVEFRASELVLLGQGKVLDLLLLDDPQVNGLFNDLSWARIVESPVYRRTATREAEGVKDLRAGRYDLNSQGYQFSK